MSKHPPPAPHASAVGPCPTVIQNVGRPGTGSLPSTIAPPDHPNRSKISKTLFLQEDGKIHRKRNPCEKVNSKTRSMVNINPLRPSTQGSATANLRAVQSPLLVWKKVCKREGIENLSISKFLVFLNYIPCVGVQEI